MISESCRVVSDQRIVPELCVISESSPELCVMSESCLIVCDDERIVPELCLIGEASPELSVISVRGKSVAAALTSSVPALE